MDKAVQARLQSGIRLRGRPRWQKPLFAPLKMARTFARQARCRVTREPLPVVVKTFWGASMNGYFPEQGAIALANYGFIEMDLTALMIHVLRPGMTVVDVGSHLGYFSLLASHLVGPTGRVHAFEPTPSTFRILTRNCEPYSNISTNNAAVFSTATTLEIEDFGVEYSQYNSIAGGKLEEGVHAVLKPERRTVPAVTIDEYLAGKPGCDFVKIDAEKAETAVLEGMRRTLETSRPYVSIEVDSMTGGDLNAVELDDRKVRMLLDHEYVPIELTNGSIRQLNRDQWRSDRHWGSSDHNLVFAPKSRLANAN